MSAAWSPQQLASFWGRVRITTNPNECWEWQGARVRLYGTFRFAGRNCRTHRLAWIIANNREPVSCILHSCDNPPCVNPRHLREGTQAENVKECAAKGRNKGPKPALRKLTSDQAQEIRSLYERGTVGYLSLAAKYRVHRTTIKAIVQNKIYRDAGEIKK